MTAFPRGSYVEVWVSTYRDRIPAGVLEIVGSDARLLLPDGRVETQPTQKLCWQGFTAPRAELRPGDIVTIPDAFQGLHEVLAVGDFIDLRHCESGGRRTVVAGTHMLVTRRADVADLYTDFRLPVPKPAHMEKLFPLKGGDE